MTDKWFTARKLAGQPGMPGTDRNVREKASRESWPYQEAVVPGGKQRQYPLSALPPETQVALALREAGPETPVVDKGAVRESLWRSWQTKNDEARARAEERLAAVEAVHTLVAEGRRVNVAVAAVSARTGAGVRSIKRWLADVKGHPKTEWLPLLADAYAGRRSVAECDGPAWEMFKADYLRVEAPAAKACYDRLQRAALAQGWTIPSLPILRRRLEKEIPQQVLVYKRGGREALSKLYPAQQRDVSMLHALQAVNADGHKGDNWVLWPDGTVARPVMVVYQDIYSRKILSWRIDRTENADVVRLAFGDVVDNWGIPAEVLMDNGRGFAGKYLSGGATTRFRFKIRPEDPVGVLKLLGIQIHWATPYSGQSKPIERAFGDVMTERVARHPALAGSYTGNRPDHKPENYKSVAIPLAEYCRVLNEEIALHNARKRDDGIWKGRSFDAVFAESYAQSPIAKATAEQRRMWLLAAESVTIQRRDGTVKLAGNRYWHEALHEHLGQKAVLRFDPDNLHGSVWVYSHDGRYICEAPCLAPTGFFDTAAARAHAKGRKQFIKGTNLAAEAGLQMRPSDVAALLPSAQSAPQPEAKVVRLVSPTSIVVKNRPEKDVALEQAGNDVEVFGQDELRRARAAGIERLRDVG